MDDNKALIVIPASMKSKRLPCKPMLEVAGEPLLHYIYDVAEQVNNAKVIIASENYSINEYCDQQSLDYWSTYISHPTGTHRCAGAALGFTKAVDVNFDVVVNWQVDEPEVYPKDVDRLIKLVRKKNNMATIVSPLSRWTPNEEVKVVFSDGYCHWFDRSPTFLMNCPIKNHVGIYAYPVGMLEHLGKMKTTELSRSSSLEQLAWIENGFRIRGMETEKSPHSINTPEDFEQFRQKVEG